MSTNKNDLATLGKVFLVGAGPGAADLITVRGAKLLAQADIVFYDSLVEPEMLALCPQAILVPVGKRCGKLSSAQYFINKRLVDAAHQYSMIVRLKGGDPMLFGRADEELSALKNAGIEVGVVPGITAALAAAASLGQSLTLRGVSRSVAFVTLAQGEDSTPSVQPISTPAADTLIYYMGRKDAVKIAHQLIEHSSNQTRDTPVFILESVSTTRERKWSGTLGELAIGKAGPWFNSASPALIMIGSAFSKADQCVENLEVLDTKLDNRLQDSFTLTNSRRCA
ncbi:uroporphyrinogen-III C-methyltransferase [Polynucleobacter brandtiae]|uniref:uroporphyrinogen-III C-methyltransferase n=1 Tax=Polynucleobacter brandtiae TaxID=1938816 RepID=A0A2M8VXR8_9BURK|nr:uroporphyrinogen-III C-methyltransferase [Polynucleobacter brandtiae]PJI82645.1 uroporphyrin-III C-methyltransferase [Polynucleobacter brandtiae]